MEKCWRGRGERGREAEPWSYTGTSVNVSPLCSAWINTEMSSIKKIVKRKWGQWWVMGPKLGPVEPAPKDGDTKRTQWRESLRGSGPTVIIVERQWRRHLAHWGEWGLITCAKHRRPQRSNSRRTSQEGFPDIYQVSPSVWQCPTEQTYARHLDTFRCPSVDGCMSFSSSRFIEYLPYFIIKRY